MFFKVNVVKRLFTITSLVILLLCLTTACGRRGPDAPPDKTPPEIVATNPALGSVDVPSNTAISVTFSELVDAETISFLLISAGTVTVPCTMIYSDKTATFTPSNALAYNTQYFATINAGVTDMLGNVMPGKYPWSFTTGTAPDTTPPAVLPNTVVPVGTNVSIFPTISVTFSEPVNPSTVNSGTVKVSGNGAEVPGTVTLDITGTKAIFVLSGLLAYNTTYTVTIVGGASGVKDMAGNALVADYIWSFTTAPQPPYTITASAGANGTISPAGSVGVNSGASQQFTITPNTGYHVANVLVDGVSVGAVTTYTFTNITANHTIAASFSITTYTVTPSVSGGNGTISPSTPQTVNYNTTTTFTLSPSSGYQAVMSGTCGGTLSGNGLSYTTNAVTANCTVIASFSNNTYTVTPSVSGGNGTISPSTPQTVNYNTTTTFTLSPSTGYHAVMSGTCGGTLSGDGLSYTTNAVTADCTVVASFTNQYALVITIVGPGSVTSNPAGINCGSICSALYVVGTPVDLSATPNGSHVFNGWSGDCTAFGTTNPASVLMDGDRTCTATFGN